MNKLLSCRYNMDTNRVEARFEDGTTLAIDCIAVEDEYGNSPAQRAELDWLLYNKPLEYAQLVLGEEMERAIFPLAARMADWRIEPQKTRGKTANRAARVSARDQQSLFLSNFSHFLSVLEGIARFFARNNRAARVFIADFLLSSIFFRAPLLLLQSSLHLIVFGEYGTPDLLCIHTVPVLSDS